MVSGIYKHRSYLSVGDLSPVKVLLLGQWYPCNLLYCDFAAYSRKVGLNKLFGFNFTKLLQLLQLPVMHGFAVELRVEVVRWGVHVPLLHGFLSYRRLE